MFSRAKYKRLIKYIVKYTGFTGVFSEGLAAVRQGKEWFHILPNGYSAYEKRYEWAGPFCGGRAEVQENGKKFCIKRNGQKIHSEHQGEADD